ncbi:MAG: sulfite exporter TauE/SafE family protein, partial [Planctomycetota bacterium]
MTPWLDSFVFGAANSLHCACMCGPLAMVFHGGTKGAVSYHLGRTFSYGAIGVALGGLGSAVGAANLGTPTAVVAFVLAAGLVVLALLGERGALAIPGLGNALNRALAGTRRWSPGLRAGALGLC